MVIATVTMPGCASVQAVAYPLLTIARLQYDGGGDWYANPSSLPNPLEAIGEGTSLRVAERTVAGGLSKS